MKRVLFLIALLLMFSAVEAGRSIPLDFNQKDSYTIPMILGDRVSFNLKGDHTIILDKINKESVELDVFLFLETKHNPYYVFMDMNHSSKVDFERDGKKDLLIRLISFDDKKAIIEFTNLNPGQNKEIKLNIMDYLYWIIAGVIFVILLIFVYFRAKKSQKDLENAGAGI